MAQKEQALVNILERLANEMTQQDEMLAELLERQDSLAGIVESAGLHLRGGQTETERTYDRLLNAVSQYRSDMLSLVNEQDRINKNIGELEKVLKITTYSIDTTNKKLAEIDTRFAQHEKITSELLSYTAKQSDIYRESLEKTSRDFAALHAGTEKHLSEFSKETVQQLNNFHHEIMRRLLVLDGIVTSLQTLIARTDPASKKPVWIVRMYKKIIKNLTFCK